MLCIIVLLKAWDSADYYTLNEYLSATFSERTWRYVHLIFCIKGFKRVMGSAKLQEMGNTPAEAGTWRGSYKKRYLYEFGYKWKHKACNSIGCHFSWVWVKEQSCTNKSSSLLNLLSSYTILYFTIL